MWRWPWKTDDPGEVAAMKRIFLIVLDSFGIGAMPDSEQFGDVGVNTLRSCQATGILHIPNMIAAGLGCIALSEA